MTINLNWKRAETPLELHSLLETLGEEFPIGENDTEIKLSFRKGNSKGECRVLSSDNTIKIEYGSVNCAARAVGKALAGQTSDEKIDFTSLGIMLDCSRNAVMTVKYLKKWLRRLALMGYNTVMLYTEDTYKLPNEPFFGFLRGAYSLGEMKEIDNYASRLGIQMIACIQTLGHLEHFLKWPDATPVRDTNRVLLVDEEKTYELIEKMISFWSEAFKSRRIHIGMDETHDLGRGVFMDKFGYERGFDIFNRHLSRVEKICQRHDLKTMIWSDMYFRMGNEKLDYYDPTTIIPKDVQQVIPKNVELVYWDYYHRDEAFYTDWIKRHRDIGFEPLMGSGCWTWNKTWYDHRQTIETAGPCLSACRKAGLKEIFFTLWGDDGAYCEYDSVMAGLAWVADISFGGMGNATQIEPFFKAICGGSYEAYLKASEMQVWLDKNEGSTPIDVGAFLWDDPLLGVLWLKYQTIDQDCWTNALKKWRELKNYLTLHRNDKGDADMEHAWNICNAIICKAELKQGLDHAYSTRNHPALIELKNDVIPKAIENIKVLSSSFRSQWMRRNKPFGYEMIQTRLAGQIVRFEEIAVRLEEYIKGQCEQIDELEMKYPLSNFFTEVNQP